METSDNSGRLLLVPSSLGKESLSKSLLPSLQQEIMKVNFFVVESEKASRKFLKEAVPSLKQQDIKVAELSKHRDNDFESLLEHAKSGGCIALLSDAGCPAIADPGSQLVRKAHELGIRVVPWVGASSIFLALMASGLSGQSFVFHGYIPRERSARLASIKHIEKDSARLGQTQILIETPYRNELLFDDLMRTLKDKTDVCIAAGLLTPEEYISTKPVEKWRLIKPEISKIPTVFLLLAY